MDDHFSLHNLQVSVTGDPASFVCGHTVGLAFRVEGENLIFDASNNSFSLYALAALLPFLPAKQRTTHENDWMTTDDLIACPDPHCGAQFKVERVGQTTFKHSEITKVPLPKQGTPS